MGTVRTVIILVCVVVLSSGCATMKQNATGIDQLKSQMATVENALARQNLLLQQNKNEIDALYDRQDQTGIEIGQVRQRQELTEKAITRQPIMVKPTMATTSKTTMTKTSPSVISDKLSPRPSVTDVQKALRNAGFYRGVVDGKAGPMTRDAILKFQKANGLTADGVVGKQTWSMLKDYV